MSDAIEQRATISLTFDDGFACQRQAFALLEERGLCGTFYVGSDFIGRSKQHLQRRDLLDAQARGHEIGGHTLAHAHLTDLSERRARKQIVGDRLALRGLGFDAVTFAYPYGEHDERSRALVREAGYVGARAVGGVVETVPPADRFALRTPHSARTRTGVADLCAFVRVAEHESCWMILVFHHVCADTASEYATTPQEFAEFLDWLVTRDIVVRRVRDVLESH
jgi:peptidoglycan/xylan/chitin deacetylase (PgdA/CDA1 family)